MTFEWSTRTIEEQGLMLPWQRIERYGPITIEGYTTDKPPKGTVLEEGTVFVPYDVLWAVAERTSDDAFMGNMPPHVGYHEQLALEQAGLADGETRGGCHGTDKLREFLKFDG